MALASLNTSFHLWSVALFFALTMGIFDLYSYDGNYSFALSRCQEPNPILLASQSSLMIGVWWYEVECAFLGGVSCRSIGEFNES
jgi:hypothetical protein